MMTYIFCYILSCILVILLLTYIKMQIIYVLCIIYLIPFVTVISMILCFTFTYPIHKKILYNYYKNKIKILKGALFLKLSTKLEKISFLDSYRYFEPFIGLEYLDNKLKNNELYDSQILNIIGEYLDNSDEVTITNA
jgi:hypothetical protein